MRGFPDARPLRERLRAGLTAPMTQWAEAEYGDAVQAVPVDAVYRDTRPNAPTFGAIPLAHADFASLRQACARFAPQWKPHVEQTLGRPLGQDEYAALNTVGMVNVWMPLDEMVFGSHLGLLDASAVRPGQLQPYAAQRRDGSQFSARLLQGHARDAWLFVPGMGCGDALIFDSQRTPHAAVNPSDESTRHRRSVEVRCLIVRLSGT